MKKLGAILLCVIVLFAFCSCGKDNGSYDKKGENEKNTDTRLYMIEQTNLSDAEIEHIISILYKRADMLAEKTTIKKNGEKDGHAILEISLTNSADDVFSQITVRGKVEFIEEYGTDKQKVILTNEDIKSAAVNVDSVTGYANMVNIVFTDEGAQKFEEATQRNIGKTIAIVYDGVVISEPKVNVVITDGKVQINGIETNQKAREMASCIANPYLKYDLTEVN